MQQSGLPIDEALPALRAALHSRNAAVLQAPPGAGKSTVVPLQLLAESWVAGRRILMLEPRRLAARAVAARMAATFGESVGATVGYRMRLDTRVGPRTRIEVVTEGVLTRLLHEDPALERYALVIFDEFHERSLQADLGLALVLQARSMLETDLRLLVMSATLDGAAVAGLLGEAPVISASGRAYEVDTHYLGKGLPLLPGGDDSPERAVVLAIRRALREQTGDVLVFLPGAPEIRRVQSSLGSIEEIDDRVQVLPLYGELDAREQDAALERAASGLRRVILATNIAETSLTIPGIRIVVDSGLVRRAVFDPLSGMSRLETQRISRAAADQRRGRAGRVEAGICYRLWSEGAQRSLAAFTAPEILDSDLAPLALDLARWGSRDDAALRWLDPPPPAMLASARDLLRRLGAIDDDGKLTQRGSDFTRLPAHPRLAQLLRVAHEHGAGRLGGELAALLSERDLLRGGRETRGADVLLRLDALRGRGGAAPVDSRSLDRARRMARQFEQMLPGARGAAPSQTEPPQDALVGGLLAAAYPDRIGRLRAGGDRRYQLTNGRGARFDSADRLAQREFIVAVDLDDREREARILLAAALDRADIDLACGEHIRRREVVEWSSRDAAVIARTVEQLDELILAEKPRQPTAEQAIDAMLTGLRELGLEALPWDEETRSFQARVGFVRGLQRAAASDWPDLSDAALLAQLGDWLPPWLAGITRRAHLTRLPLLDALRGRLSNSQQRMLEEWAPTHLVLPTGTRVRIDYVDALAPCASMRMQEVFGLAETPRIGGGTVPVTFKLLSPAQRPLQVTRDLASFWRNAYVEVRKDMRGRYPRHYWPENPLEAEPTRGIKRRSPR